MNQAKPYCISKQIVWEAYKRVRTNKGAAGVDEETISSFEREIKNNLYKLWNRMSSGSYFPAAVRRVEIPKASGGKRPLGIPTVADRIAQTVVKMYLEPKLESYFHKDSYGYRPKKSAIEALGVARKRCWCYDWVLDLDIRGFFDNLDHELLMRAVRKHTDCKWILLYIERWLKASVQCEDGTLIYQNKGVPQGGVVSPLLANLFLHYALDEWMRKNYPNIPFERFADDAVIHCKTETEAEALKIAIGERLAQCKLELHPDKTRIVYCKDGKRRRDYPNEKFDFLGYTFRPRRSKDHRGEYFVNFSPAVSAMAIKSMQSEIRHWRLQCHSGQSLEDISQKFNPILRGWINYYGRYYKSALYPPLRQLDRTLIKWAMRKYKRLRGRHDQTIKWLKGVARSNPNLFGHWQMGLQPTFGR